jgi:Tol biopolymer transport system component
LWLIDVDMAGNVSEPERLHTAPGGDFDPAWSPDGGVIAFSSIRDGRPQIYVMQPNGDQLQNLTGDLGHDREPAWSPIGDQLVFTSSRAGPIYIWIMPEEGGKKQQFSGGGDRDDTHPDWSHDGQTVIFERSISGLPRLVVAPFPGERYLDQLVCPEGDRSVQPMSEPNWSPDDQWIVFETWPDGVNHDIAIMRSGCTNYSLITTDPSRDFDAAWRPGS